MMPTEDVSLMLRNSRNVIKSSISCEVNSQSNPRVKIDGNRSHRKNLNFCDNLEPTVMLHVLDIMGI